MEGLAENCRLINGHSHCCDYSLSDSWLRLLPNLAWLNGPEPLFIGQTGLGPLPAYLAVSIEWCHPALSGAVPEFPLGALGAGLNGLGVALCPLGKAAPSISCSSWAVEVVGDGNQCVGHGLSAFCLSKEARDTEACF